MPSRKYSHKPMVPLSVAHFDSAQQAWLWACAHLRARAEGARAVPSSTGLPRPCEPDDVLLVFRRARRLGILAERQAQVMLRYGARLMPPDPALKDERCAADLWDGGLAVLGTVLRQKNILL